MQSLLSQNDERKKIYLEAYTSFLTEKEVIFNLFYSCTNNTNIFVPRDFCTELSLEQENLQEHTGSLDYSLRSASDYSGTHSVEFSVPQSISSGIQYILSAPESLSDGLTLADVAVSGPTRRLRSAGSEIQTDGWQPRGCGRTSTASPHQG